uniref:glucose-6-phosphate 1-epimerase n=1 Tax=Albugo laibachii Nc14 TaxID=890382 RepID=F0WC46_9STRA|nr:aldose 1epimerase putative [Albugo laibachii Nc14]CCA25205.1 aldose 1epimerase putative [Albugo laibachii Nc14]|eukprot:CCA25205.1 aldose 1epimerase putative [Albugo laibachii Nc14]
MSDSVIVLRHSSGARAEIFKFGTTVKSFFPAQQNDVDILFVSKKAVKDGSRPIRGGIPLVFPVFGAAKGLPNHGFARLSKEWEFELVGEKENRGLSPAIGVFTLHDTEYSRSVWPYKFELKYTIRVYADSLETSLQIHNHSDGKMEFQTLFHTYFACYNVKDNCWVAGLKGISYFDKVHSKEKKEQEDRVCIKEETDRVYADAPNTVLISLNRPTGETHKIVIEKKAFFHEDPPRIVSSDAVLWNPWIDKSKGMSDFSDDEFLKMLCVEVGCVSCPQKLGSKKTFELQQTIRTSLE